MQDFAHLRFDDDVFAVVQALKELRPLMAKDAREVYDDAPEGWFVVVMTVANPFDLVGIIAQVSQQHRVADELLTADVMPEGDHFVVTFLKLRGQQQTVH